MTDIFYARMITRFIARTNTMIKIFSLDYLTATNNKHYRGFLFNEHNCIVHSFYNNFTNCEDSGSNLSAEHDFIPKNYPS